MKKQEIINNNILIAIAKSKSKFAFKDHYLETRFSQYDDTIKVVFDTSWGGHYSEEIVEISYDELA